MAMKTLWMRLGVEVDMTEENYNKVIAGDMDALTDAIKQNGIDIDGDSYAPLRDEDGECTGEELEISLPSLKLVQEL